MNKDIVDIEIIEFIDTSSESFEELKSLYDTNKKSDTSISSKLSNNYTLKGLDDVRELYATAMMQIQDFVDKGKEQSTASSIGSKVLATIDSKNRHIGKWLNNKAKEIEKENIYQSTISEIVTKLVSNIEQKRNEVIELVENLSNIRTDMLSKISTYEGINAKAMAMLTNTKENTKKYFDIKQLATMSQATVQKIYSDVATDIEPLLAASVIAVDQIQAILPTIENDLQSKLSVKTLQQQLADLNTMTNSMANLAKDAGSLIRKSINDTVCESIAMLGETGLDIKAIQASAEADIKYQNKLNDIMQKTTAKINSDFEAVQKISSNLLAHRSSRQDNLITQYADSAAKE